MCVCGSVGWVGLWVGGWEGGGGGGWGCVMCVKRKKRARPFVEWSYLQCDDVNVTHTPAFHRLWVILLCNTSSHMHTNTPTLHCTCTITTTTQNIAHTQTHTHTHTRARAQLLRRRAGRATGGAGRAAARAGSGGAVAQLRPPSGGVVRARARGCGVWARVQGVFVCAERKQDVCMCVCVLKGK